MKKTVLLLAVLALFVSACGGVYSKRYTRQAVVTDYIFSVDARGNGASFAVWFRNDDIAVYCTGNSDFYNGIKAMAETYAGVMVKGNYEGDGRPVETDPCYNIESGDVASQTFKLNDMNWLICDRWFGWKPEDRQAASAYAETRNWPACNN